jgi:AraC-like DNA-binding protein
MGDLFIAHPQEPHRTGPKPNPENRHLWLGLRLSMLGLEAAGLAKKIQRRHIRLLPGCQEAEPLLNAIISQIMTLRPRRAEVIASLLHSFVCMVAQRVALAVAGDDATLLKPALPYSFAVQKAIAYMRKNLDRRLPLRELAAASTLRNASHLCTLFRREVGVTPGAYHIQLRLDAAREALRQPSVTITFVALQYGFSSSQHFSALFRDAFNLTPRQWKMGCRPNS